jgi:hypothetical protein
VHAAGILAPVPPPPPDGVTFKSVLELGQKDGSIKPMLRGGRLADSATWPASFYVSYSVNGASYTCTAALVGPQVMLTAAHCVPASGAAKIAFGAGNPYEVECARHAGFATGADMSADFALCHLKTAFVEPQGFRFETIDPAPVAGWLNRKVLLSGFGCTSDSVAVSASQIAAMIEAAKAAAKAGVPAPIPSYRIGFTKLAETSASPPKAEREQFYAPVEYFNIITAVDGANLCPGDSGGPAFVLNETSGTSFEKRAVIAVNSRVLYTDPDDPKRYGASLLAATGGPGLAGDTSRLSFIEWAKAWAAGWNAKICGLPSGPDHCRPT